MIQPSSAPGEHSSSVMLSALTIAAIILLGLLFVIGLAYRRSHPSFNDNPSDRAGLREHDRDLPPMTPPAITRELQKS